MREYYEILKVERKINHYIPGLACIYAKQNEEGMKVEDFDNYEDATKALDKYYTEVNNNNIIEYYLQKIEETTAGDIKYYMKCSLKNTKLKGTDKQIKYANDIKTKAYNEILRIYTIGGTEEEIEKAEKAVKVIDSFTNAAEIIDHSDIISVHTDLDDIINYDNMKKLLEIDRFLMYKNVNVTIEKTNLKTGRKKRIKMIENTYLQRFSTSNGTALLFFANNKGFATRGVPVRSTERSIELKGKYNNIIIKFEEK